MSAGSRCMREAGTEVGRGGQRVEAGHAGAECEHVVVGAHVETGVRCVRFDELNHLSDGRCGESIAVNGISSHIAQSLPTVRRTGADCLQLRGSPPGTSTRLPVAEYMSVFTVQWRCRDQKKTGRDFRVGAPLVIDNRAPASPDG